MMDEPHYPGAVAPERTRSIDSLGVRIQLHEWGDPEAAPVVLCHGMWDHARGFDVLAPLLATRFRVIAVDARGHGESGWSSAYTWLLDVIDVARVLRSLGRPAHLVGHSRGGGQATDAAARVPDAVRQVVNLDGFGPPPEGFVVPGEKRDARTQAERFTDYLDWRRTSARSAWRPASTLSELVERRRRQNPRLSTEWLSYFLFHGARHTSEGWRWKADPHAGRGFGPWKPSWIGAGWRLLRARMLAVTGTEPDTWGPLPEELIAERLEMVWSVERARVPAAGHFIHMEQPRATANLLLDWLEP